jgi:hypothetical protein
LGHQLHKAVLAHQGQGGLDLQVGGLRLTAQLMEPGRQLMGPDEGIGMRQFLSEPQALLRLE